MKKTLTYTAVSIVAAASLALAYLLLRSLINAFMPMPTQYENTSWVSEDGAMTFNVYEYDPNSLQCRAELVYNDSVYSVSDISGGALRVSDAQGNEDIWLRAKCSEKEFSVRINRGGNLGYASSYQESEKVRFIRKTASQ